MFTAEKLKKAMGLPRKIKPQRAVKGVIARNYYIDGNLFIERFDVLNKHENMQNKQYRAKAMVDLCMSLECSMKSLVVSLSHDTKAPGSTMKSLRKLSHHHEKLLKKIKETSRNRFTPPDFPAKKLKEIQRFGVGARYSHDIWSIQTDTFLSIEDDLLGSTINDPSWMSELRTLAVEWNNSASKCYDRYLSKHCIVSGKDHARFNKELKKFKADM